MILTVLISTLDEGISNVPSILLTPRMDVKYIVIHQFTDKKYLELQDELKRADVNVYSLAGKGLSKSRNKAIGLVDSELGLIADDDVSYTDEYMDRIISHFKENEDMDIACFKIETPEGQPEYKMYPRNKIKLSKLSISPSSIEIAFRPKAVKASATLFDTSFGLGATFLGGEESIFISDCIKKNLSVFFIPEFIVKHPFESSVKNVPKFHKSRNEFRGAVDYRLNGSIAYLKAIYFVLRNFRALMKHKINPLTYIKQRWSGCSQVKNTN